LNLVGETQVIFGSDMPHGDRERCAARMLQERRDIRDAAKLNILEKNPGRLYGIP
jgi:predicted TIM-barrel fold metal-dependent hydrolase